MNKSDATQYEEIDNFDNRPSTNGRDLNSGNTLNKMKHRPLPPPPRPPRDRKQRKPNEDNNNKHDKDGGGERILIPTTLEDISRISSVDMEEIEEVEAATQTDPLPDDFECEDFEITENMKVIEPSGYARRSKTLEDILKEEQQAELDRAKQIADEECLSKGIQKFRDANQRSYSERSKGSSRPGSRPGSRPITPSALVIEKKITLSTTETDARLIVRPVAEDYLTVPRIDSLDDDHDSDVKYLDDTADTADTEDERIVTEALRRYRLLDEDLQRDRAAAAQAESDRIEAERLEAEREEARWEEERLEEIRLEEARLERARLEKVRQEEARLEEARRVEARLEEIRQEEARRAEARLEEIRREEANRAEAQRAAIERAEAEWAKAQADAEARAEADARVRGEAEARVRAEAEAHAQAVAELSHLRALKQHQDLEATEESVPVIPPRPARTSSPPAQIREEEVFEEELPMPPPRRRSTGSDATAVATTEHAALMEPIAEQRIEAIADPPLELLRGGRLHITDLEVENLSVNALQAGRILVSDLQAISLNSQELECKSGNLVVRGIELPAGFIEELVDRVRSSERQQPEERQPTVVTEANVTSSEQTAPQQPPPERPPPPPQSLYPSDYAPYSIPPPSFYQLRNYAEDVEPASPQTPTATRRRRHHRRRDDSTSEEDYQREHRRSARHSTHSPEPSISHLTGQLVRACSSAVGRTGNSLLNMIRAARAKDENGNRADANLGLIILIVIVAVLMMLGMSNGSGRAVHHHHWDYFNPPENEGRN